jgi:hypothetical protein
MPVGLKSNNLTNICRDKMIPYNKKKKKCHISTNNDICISRLNSTELQKRSTTSILIHKNCDDKVNFDYRPILNNNSTNNNHNDINYNNKTIGDVKL